MPSRYDEVAYCSAPLFEYRANSITPRPYRGRLCRAKVTINAFKSGPNIAEACPGCITSDNYTCDTSLAVMKTYLAEHYERTSQGHFVEICDFCVPDMVATQPPEHSLCITHLNAFSPTVTLKSYEPCQCSSQYLNIIAQPFCYPCATTLLDARQELIEDREYDHPSYTEPLPPRAGWTCLCGSNFDTKSEGRALHNASICLGCAHYKIRDPDAIPSATPPGSVRPSIYSPSSSSQATSGSSTPFYLSTANTTPGSSLPSPTVGDAEPKDNDEDTAMTGLGDHAPPKTINLAFRTINYEQTLQSHYATFNDGEDEGPFGETLEEL